jgi:hypothetical protein
MFHPNCSALKSSGQRDAAIHLFVSISGTHGIVQVQNDRVLVEEQLGTLFLWQLGCSRLFLRWLPCDLFHDNALAAAGSAPEWMCTVGIYSTSIR